MASVVELRRTSASPTAIGVPDRGRAQLPREEFFSYSQLAVLDEVTYRRTDSRVPAISVAFFCANACAQSSLTVTPRIASRVDDVSSPRGSRR